MFILVTASFFFVCGVSASDTLYQTPLNPGETVSPTLSGGYYKVTLEPGQRFFFNWSIGQNGGASNITLDGVAPVSSGSSYAFIWSQVTTQIADQSGTRGYAEFVNVGSGTFTINCSVSINFTLRNNNSTTATPRVLLTVSGGQYLSSGFVTNNQLNNKLNQILDVLGQSSGSSKFLGDDALFYLNDSYFQGVNGSSGVRNFNDDGVCEFTSPATSTPYRVHYFGGDGTASGALSTVGLQSGDYVFYYSAPVEISNVIIYDWQSDYSIKEHVDVLRDVLHVGYFVIHVSAPISSWQFSLEFNDGFTGVIYGGLARMDINQSAQDAINPDQSGLVDDVDNAGQQQQQQEDQLWDNINSYKGDLTFNLDDWSEAAGGLSYVSSIFMTIWNNSPTQIIVLSLMLGIAMLSIGRGAMAAVRVSRNRRDDD